jgi:hypothetical protein
LDCRHVCKPCAFHDVLQAGKQKEVHPPYSTDLAPAGLKRPLLTVSKSFINVANSVLWRMAIILKANKVNLFVSSVFVCFLVPFTERFSHTTYEQHCANSR